MIHIGLSHGAGIYKIKLYHVYTAARVTALSKFCSTVFMRRGVQRKIVSNADGRPAQRVGSINLPYSIFLHMHESRCRISAIPFSCEIMIASKIGTRSGHIEYLNAFFDILTAPSWWGIISRIKFTFKLLVSGALSIS